MSENGEETEQKKEYVPIPGKRFFLSHCNTYEGRAIFDALWNKDKCRVPDVESHAFRGTVKKDEKTPRGAFQEPEYAKFDQLVEFERTKAFRDTLLSCDVIIYDLMSNDFEEVDYVIKTLKTSELTQ
jgi:hypothetical protein